MPIIKITTSDILRGQTLEAGWYKARIATINLKQSAKGDSTNIVVTFEIEKDNRTIDHYFNSKAMGFMLPMLRAVNGNSKIDQAATQKQDLEIDTEELVGKNLQVNLEINAYQGNLNNKVVDFLPYEASTQPVF